MKNPKRRHDRARTDVERAERRALALMRREQRTTTDPTATALEHRKQRSARRLSPAAENTIEHEEASVEYAAAAFALDEHLRKRRESQAQQAGDSAVLG